jgi:hypothetical protein
LNPVERAVMSYISMSVKQFKLSSKFTIPSPVKAAALEEVPLGGITAATGIPYNVVLDAAASLTKRLK